jgi:hypothetical protein
VAGAAGAALSGVPSTALTAATGGDVLASTRAVGRILLPRSQSTARLAVAGGAAHVAISLGWGVVLAAVLPRRHTALAGAAAGVVIAVVDVGLIGRRLPSIAGLDPKPQLLDHAAYGAIVGAVLIRLSRRRSSVPARGRGGAGSRCGTRPSSSA